jgi:hypothetical protein
VIFLRGRALITGIVLVAGAILLLVVVSGMVVVRARTSKPR